MSKKLSAIEQINRDAEDRWREAWDQLEAQRDRYREALEDICALASIWNENEVHIAHEALDRKKDGQGNA